MKIFAGAESRTSCQESKKIQIKLASSNKNEQKKKGHQN